MRKVLIVVALLAVAAFASDPRLTVLGGDARLLVNDYLEMWAYPGVIGDYEFVTGGSESANDIHDGWFAVTKDFGGNTYGVSINHNDYSHEILFSPGGWGAILSLDFKKFAPSDSTTEKNMALGLAWGTTVPLFGDFTDLSIGAGYDMISVDYNELTWSSSNMNFGASLRGHTDDFFNLFPIVTTAVNMHMIDTYDDSSTTVTTLNLDFGAGHNKKIADRTNLVVGVFGGLQTNSFSGDFMGGVEPDAEMWFTVPKITGGVEQEIAKWLVFRAGATSTSLYYTRDEFNSFSTGFDTHFGVGLHWDNFTMDATIGEGFLHDGPYLVGGNDNGFMGSLAATYTF